MSRTRCTINMAEKSMAEILKRFALRITTPKVTERLQLLEELHPLIKNEELPEPAVKGILKHLLYTLDRYEDAKSRNAVVYILELLASKVPEPTYKSLALVLSDWSEKCKRFSHSKSLAASSLNALTWTCVLLRHPSAAKLQDGDLRKMITVQTLLIYGALCSENASVNSNVHKKLYRMWAQNSRKIDVWIETVQNQEQSLYQIPIMSCIVKYLHSTKQTQFLDQIKDKFMEVYTKQVILSKIKPAAHVFRCANDILRHCSHDNVKNTLLPAVEKAMLRNPEIALTGVCELLNGLTVDLSTYAKAFGKPLATQSGAKNDESRDLAVRATSHLARQCSEGGAMETLVKHYFGVLNGSEGKITVAPQRMGVMSAIGALSENAVTGQSAQSLITTAIECFLSVLQTESHEGTLVLLIGSLKRWSSKLTTSVPEKLTLWFKTGLGMKTSTSAVRNAYIQCMNATYKGDLLTAALPMLPLLLSTVEKAHAQSTQLPLVTEGLSAACLLIKLSLCDIQSESKLEKFWNIVTDANKQLFVTEKFLSQANDDALMTLSTLVYRLTQEHPQKLNNLMADQYYRGLIYTLTHGGHESRKLCKAHAQSMISTLRGVKIATALIQQFREFAQTQTVADLEAEQLAEGDAEKCRVVAPRVLAECLLAISVPRHTSAEMSEAETIAMETLYDAHHPLIMLYDLDTWTDLVGRLGVDAASVISSHTDQILTSLRELPSLTQAHSNAIATLVRICPDAVMPALMDLIVPALENPAMVTVTKEEYEIMLTPEGELYDKSIIHSANEKNEAAKAANMKRENKLYSYKEQMAELELKKEIERKKGIKKEEPKLTKKQQEQVQEELKRESAIRDNCKQLDDELKKMCSLVTAMSEGNTSALRQRFPELLRLLVAMVASPLAAPHVTSLLLSLRLAAFPDEEDKYFVALVGHVTLRLLKPACELDENWCDESLSVQATRAVNALHSRTVPPKGLPATTQAPLPAPGFCYCFTLLRKVQDNGGQEVNKNEAIMLKALAVVNEHAQMRQDDTSAALTDETGPELLPRKDMLHLCATVIGTHGPGKLQQAAYDTLIQTARCASGQKGCTAAEQEEVDVLLEAVQRPASIVREAALKALHELVEVLPSPDVDLENGLNLARRLWITRFDAEPTCSKLANTIWEEAELSVEPELCTMLVEDTVHDQAAVREASAQALASALEQHPDHIDAVLQQLMEVYEEKLYMPPPVLDQFGRQVSEAPPDLWHARSGIALAIRQMSPQLQEDQIEPLFTFFVERSLGDRHEEVRQRMLEAAVAAVNKHGKEHVAALLPVLERFLVEAPTDGSYDAVRQSVVILMGSLAKHLDKDDPKVKPIVAKLIEALSTPSAEVQQSVADCLPALVPAIKEEAPDLVRKLMRLLLDSNKYGDRRGAAYGIAGLVKGLGILSLKQLDIVSTLTEAIQDKKNQSHREGALFAFEMLCSMLGRMFEPYIVNILPNLLMCFGDPCNFVRQAADDCARAVMSKLSSHGVKLVLPILLEALNEDSWRTKSGSVELLGAMAHCAPKQLSACLPSIVPKLTEVLTDSHHKVQKAGGQALKQIGSVIRNPEIQAIVPILLAALQEPTKNTTRALQCLLETQFVHFIDAPSLALIMPVVQRAFQDRSTETRKMAAQIIGNMYSLTDQKDLSPYLPQVIPGLKTSLLDPVPEVRAISAHALGTMVKGMGESGFEDLVPWLMETLTSEQSTVDRSGAAQGLAEVMGGLGPEKLRTRIQEIISTAERKNIAPHVRDGYIMMYIYLPGTFGDAFLPYVGPIIPSILAALADENEYVRDTALRAGQRIVNLYADTAIELLLPQLEAGLFDDNWRIRYSSVQLLGDLLYKISGVSGKGSTESMGEDDNFGTESSQKAILRVLGEERRNRVLAGLYMGRSDTQLVVRQAALHVWKVIVTHTPKTLREILSTLFELLLSCLASTSYDKRQVAARTLGDIVKKLGEKVLPEIIPILEKGLGSDDADQRQGVCIGLSEIMSSTSREHIMVYSDSLIPTVRRALIDPLPEVRQAAAETFAHLHTNIGTRALEDILPALLMKLDDEEVKEYALDGLQQVMAQKSQVVLPYLVPELIKPPVNTKALSLLSRVADESLSRHLHKILPALLSSLSQKLGTEHESEEIGFCQDVVLAVNDDQGTRVLVTELLQATSNGSEQMRCAAITLLKAYCENSKTDLTDYVPQFLRAVTHLFIHENKTLLETAYSCLEAIIQKLDDAEKLGHVNNLRQAIKFAVSDLPPGQEELPGLCIVGKGVKAILPIFREGLLNGTNDLKEYSAIGMGELVRRSSVDALKPSVVHITGPLIRVLGDRFQAPVKVAILDTLALLISKCGMKVKPFLPQLQITFMKALNDPERKVRIRSACALGQLVGIHTRVDPLFTELLSTISSSAEAGVRETTLHALRRCIVGAGDKMGDKLRGDVTSQLQTLLSSSEEVTRVTSAACLGCLCRHLKDNELATVMERQLLDTDTSVDWMLRHGRSVALGLAIKEGADVLMTSPYADRIRSAALKFAESDRVPITLAGLRAVGYLLRHLAVSNESLPKPLLQAVINSMKQESNDVKALGALIVTYVARSCDAALEISTQRALVPMLVNGSKERNTLVRTNSEQALVALLRLRHGEETLTSTVENLEAGMRDSLAEMTSRLRKMAAAPDSGPEELDDTQLV